MNYREFLDSPDWKRIRDRVMMRDAYTCQHCGHRAKEVHHIGYEHGWINPNLMLALCGKCHRRLSAKDHPDQMLFAFMKRPLPPIDDIAVDPW